MYQKLSDRKRLRGSVHIQDTGITLLQDGLYISATVIFELTRFKNGQSARNRCKTFNVIGKEPLI